MRNVSPLPATDGKDRKQERAQSSFTFLTIRISIKKRTRTFSLTTNSVNPNDAVLSIAFIPVLLMTPRTGTVSQTRPGKKLSRGR